MDENGFDSFYGKILLFGEYSIILGGQAVVVPLRKFSGNFDFPLIKAPVAYSERSNASLRRFMEYLLSARVSIQLPFAFDKDRFREDIENGLFFHSNIPQGYGAGSSGALVASVFHHYCIHGFSREQSFSAAEVSALILQLSVMESFFHGTSSGLDPLCCYTNRSLHVGADKTVSFPDITINDDSLKSKVFLIDTAIKRTTLSLVQRFSKDFEKGNVNAQILEGLTNETLLAYLNGDEKMFDNFLSQLSFFQLENMKPMIPEIIRNIWYDGLYNRSWTLKLCGSGGGGFIMGFSTTIETVKDVFPRSGFEVITL